MNTQQWMHAAWYEKQGIADDVIQFGEMPIPEPGTGDVRVRVHASGVNPSDMKTRSGSGGSQQMFPRIIPHQDGAGVIDSLGEGVLPSRMGERVWVYQAQRGRAFGTAAEFVVIPSQQAIPLPDNTSFAEGACLGVPAMTAHRCVFADGLVKGQTVLVTGGAGAVGYYAIQLAKWGGATVVTTVSRPEQAQLAQGAGADHIIDYKTEDTIKRIQEITEVEHGIDRIVDVNFLTNLHITEAVLKSNGIVATYSVGSSDIRPALPALSFLAKALTIRFVSVYIMPDEAKQQATRDITTVLKSGALHHNIAQRFSLNEVASAHDAQESGRMIGKAIIEITK